jgi:hypothetical protein
MSKARDHAEVLGAICEKFSSDTRPHDLQIYRYTSGSHSRSLSCWTNLSAVHARTIADRSH